MNTKELILDFDSTLVDTKKAMLKSIRPFIKDISQKPDINSIVTKWDFSDVIPQSHLRYVNTLFCSNILFENMEFFPNTLNVLNDLNSKGVRITICSIGTPENIKYKIDFIKKYLPFVEFVPIVKFGNVVMNKKIVNMQGAIFIDDNVLNLESSNADLKILYKHDNVDADFNRDWNGLVATSWESKEFLDLLYKNLGIRWDGK